LANEQWAKLPAHYLEIVKLLVLWMPHDARLRWLMAELVNANGGPQVALGMMEELSSPPRNFRNAELAAHQLTLHRAIKVAERLAKLRKPFVEENVADPLPVLAVLLPPGPNAALNAVNTARALDKIFQMPLPNEEDSFATDLAASPATPASPSQSCTPE